MERACPPWLAACVFSGRPNVGDLMSLCEENFHLLSRLAPHLAERSGVYVSRSAEGVELRLDIEGQAPFTTFIGLTHRFLTQGVTLFEPDARLRIYHDARQLEVIDLRQTRLPLQTHYRSPALAEKWQANLFVSKWLAYCLQQGYLFGDAQATARPSKLGVRIAD